MRQLHPRRIALASILSVILIIIAIAALSGLLAVGDNGAAGTKPSGDEDEIKGTATVTTVDAKQGELSPVALAYGTIGSSPQHTFIIALMRDGIFKTVHVRDGDVVRAGQPIVSVITAPANTAAYAQAKSALEFAGQDLTRITRMFADRLATNDQLASARRALADAKVQMAQQSTIGAGSAEAVLRAPFDGVITGLMAMPGDKMQANTPIAMVSSRTNVIVQLGLEPSDASKLAPGAPVRLNSTIANAAQITGQLASISANIDPLTRLVKATVDLPAATGASLTLGETLVAHIELPKRQGIVIPRAALLEDAGGPYIFTIAGGKAHKQTVNVLVETDAMALIDTMKSELGKKVVISGNTELDDGTPVQEAKS